MDRIKSGRIYIISIALALLIVESFFALQVTFVLDDFKLHYVVIPTLLGISIGFLIGKTQVLKQQLLQKKRLFHAIADEAREFSYYRRLDGTYEYVSPAVKSLTGFERDDFYAQQNFFSTLVIDEDRALWERHVEGMQLTDSHESIHFRIINKEGKVIWVDHNCSAVYEDGEKVGIRSVNTDITKRKEDEAAISILATYDPLTDLPNRSTILQKMEELIEDETPFAILFLDLNRFKIINDSLGHNTGDLILIQVAKQLKMCLKEKHFVGRLGGDEFLVLLEGTIDKEEVEPTAQTLFGRIGHDYSVDDYTFYISASIGVAFYPGDSRDRQELLACADKAMYSAKNVSSTGIVYYRELMRDNRYDQVLLEKELRSALDAKELSVHLQPKVDVRDEKIVSYEALLRWNNRGTMMAPMQFLPMAEETGLIKEITRFVIDEVFAVARRWHEAGLLNKISINISMIDFMSDRLIEYIIERLEHHHVKAQWFELEMTETIFLENHEKIVKKIDTLIEMGFKIALDDFGTGYSSLAYLTKFPIDTLKIDKVFIDNLGIDHKKNYVLLNAIVGIAMELELDLVIEGVETSEQIAILKEMGCHVVQGHYFYRAMEIEAVEQLAIQTARKS